MIEQWLRNKAVRVYHHPRTGDVVVQSSRATEKRAVVVRPVADVWKFKINAEKASSSVEGKPGKSATFDLVLWDGLRNEDITLLSFKEREDAEAALKKLEGTLLRPVWKKVSALYQTCGVLVALLVLQLVVAAVTNRLPVPGATSSLTAAGIDPKAIAALRAQQANKANDIRSTQQSLTDAQAQLDQFKNQASPGGMTNNGLEGLPFPVPPANGVPSTPTAVAPTPVPPVSTPGNTVLNALSPPEKGAVSKK